MVELTASGDAEQVEARLRQALNAHGLQLFARIDHAAARAADRSAHQAGRCGGPLSPCEDQTGELTRDSRARPISAGDKLRPVPIERRRSS